MSDTPTASPGSAQVDQYLDALDPAQRAPLDAVRASLRKLLPDAEEGLRYGMPAMSVGGKGVAGYAAHHDHWGYYPMSGTVTDLAGDAVAKYEKTKGGFRVGFDQRLPVAVVRTMVRLRLAEIEAAKKPKRSRG